MYFRFSSIHQCIVNLLCHSFNTTFTSLEASKCIILKYFLTGIKSNLECDVSIKYKYDSKVFELIV